MDWNPLLHPRGRDGRFIEVGGWVRGFFNGQERRAKVQSVVENPNDFTDPLIVTDVGTSPASRVTKSVAPKARVAPDWQPGHYESQPLRFEFGDFFDEPRQRHVPRVEGWVQRVQDGTYTIDLESHGTAGGSTPWLDTSESGFRSLDDARAAAESRFQTFLEAEAGSHRAEVLMNLNRAMMQRISEAVEGGGPGVSLMMGSTNSKVHFRNGLIEWDGRIWHSIEDFFDSLS